MKKIALKRLLESIPVLWAIVTITFFLIRLAPGGPFDREKELDPQIQERIEAHYNLNAPLFEQYTDYLGGLVKGDFGPSYKNTSSSVNELIAQSFPVSLELGFYALCVALLIGLSAGIIAALKPNSWQDYTPMTLAMIGICVPNFVLGPILLLIFGINLGWFPVSGWEEAADKILPSITLGAMYAAYIARLSRGGMLEVLSNDFIRTARAKGLSESRVILKHALRGGVTPVIAFLGPATAGLLSGSFVVETVFQIPGLGKLFVESAFNRDYTMILGTVILYATLILILNLLSDLLLTWIDPRLRDA